MRRVKLATTQLQFKPPMTLTAVGNVCRKKFKSNFFFIVESARALSVNLPIKTQTFFFCFFFYFYAYFNQRERKDYACVTLQLKFLLNLGEVNRNYIKKEENKQQNKVFDVSENTFSIESWMISSKEYHKWAMDSVGVLWYSIL